jgi:hypothetical protein
MPELPNQPKGLANGLQTTVVNRPVFSARTRKTDTKAAQSRFLACYSGCGDVLASSRAARVQRNQHYNWLRNDPTYPERFKQAHALAVRTLEDEAVRRARLGVKRLVMYKGKPCKLADGTYAYETEYSDNLLMFLLKAYDRKRFGDKIDTTFGPNWSGNIEDLPEEFLRQVLALIEAQAAAIAAKEQSHVEAGTQTVDVTPQPPTPLAQP